ncbi:MAG: hypothetical protein QOE72_1424 [Chloroflexota bacterium]|jgi:hypothetical protein|nr:hypothetical protein [Chloroflexota bacterium]
MTTATALTLDRGTHDSAEEGACLLELVSLLAGEEFSDAPRCVSPVLANAGRAWNDSLGDEERQRLLGYADRLLGTADAAAADAWRSWVALDWLVRVCAAGWLDAAGLGAAAAAHRALPPLVDRAGVSRAASAASAAAAEAVALLDRLASGAASAEEGSRQARRAGYLAAAATGREAAAAAAWPGTAAEDADRDDLREQTRRTVLRLAQAVALTAPASAAAADPLGALDAVAPALRPIHDSMWELFERLVTGPRRTGVDGGETEREVDAVRRHRP